jgi:GntR family transcriptional regulator/MocR family aminotransferase
MPSYAHFIIKPDRRAATSLSHQVCDNIRTAIDDGRIEIGARLPSVRDLASQLGVARGTVQAAYDALMSELLLSAAGSAGTRVIAKPPVHGSKPTEPIVRPLSTMLRGFSLTALPFQTGVPAQDAFPTKLWTSLLGRAVRDDAMTPTTYPDPRGHPELRAQIAAYLAIARGIRCTPDQVIVTVCYRAGLALALQVLAASGQRAWMEEPGYPITRMGLEMARVSPVAVPVDSEGIEVAVGMALAPDASIAIVTPGQHSPLGATMSYTRRQMLLDWADAANGWIIEDDYLGELQLGARAAPALASGDTAGRVIHVGSFSKTLKPGVGIGFVVAPMALANRFGEAAATLGPNFFAPSQLAIAQLLAEGHYLRHLRNMQRLYAERLSALHRALATDYSIETVAGPIALLRLPEGIDDMALARRAPELGIAPSPLSPWFQDAAHRTPGLLLSATNLRPNRIADAVAALRTLLADRTS